MFRASSAHLQEDTDVHMQHMVVTLYESSWWPVGTQLPVKVRLLNQIDILITPDCRSQWPRGLRRRSTAARLLMSWVRIPPREWMFVL